MSWCEMCNDYHGEMKLTDGEKAKLKELSDGNQGSGKAILLDDSLNEIKKVSVKSLNNTLRRIGTKPSIIILDGTVTSPIITAAEEIGCAVIIAKNFATTDTKIQLLSL